METCEEFSQKAREVLIWLHYPPDFPHEALLCDKCDTLRGEVFRIINKARGGDVILPKEVISEEELVCLPSCGFWIGSDDEVIFRKSPDKPDTGFFPHHGAFYGAIRGGAAELGEEPSCDIASECIIDVKEVNEHGQS
jgi:hypothetical protein